MSNSTVHNLLVGSWDLSTVSWGNKAKRSSETFRGAAVADLGAGQGGIEFPNSSHRADARVTSGAEYVLSFWARADVDGDGVHSEVWGSLYMLDTTLTTEWQQVVMPYGIRRADQRRVYFWGLGTNSGTVHVALPMCVRGTEPAAWAPAEGETLAGGGGALMSANLLDGLTPELANGTSAESDGTWHHAARTNVNGHDDWLMWDLPDQAALETNQTYHVGLSVRGASANDTSLHATIGYKDAAGSINYVTSSGLAIGTSWGRVEGTIVVPSGMKPFAFYVAAYGVCPETWMAAPTLSLGSPVVLAISSSTLAWSAGILATVRYYQLAAPTAATPTVPTSSSSLGSWTETEPTADVTKVLWTCERTVYADGTESWSKASKSTSYEAAKDAQSTATDAQNKAAALATVIHDGADGVSVGRSADGGATYPQGRTRQSSDAFEVLDDSGKTLSSFSKDKVRLGVGSSTSEIDMADGHGKIFGYLDPQIADPGDGITELRISSDKFLTLHGANEALLYATPSSTVVEYQNSTHATINVSSEIDDHTFSSDVRLEATAVDETDSDYETKSTITMLASDGATLNGAQILTAPTVLFYNEAQALNTAVPLSDSAGNYKRLKIFYKSDDSDYCSVEVYHPDGKTVALQIARPTYEYATGAAPVIFLKSKIVKISGATIDTVTVSTYGGGTNYLRMQKNLSGDYEASDKIGIIRVEGYKW